jgi:hypothetical protein
LKHIAERGRWKSGKNEGTVDTGKREIEVWQERRSVRRELEVQYWEEGRWKCGKKRDGSEERRDVHM